MSEDKEELLQDAIDALQRMKRDAGLWHGKYGFSPNDRQDVNDLLKRHRELAS